MKSKTQTTSLALLLCGVFAACGATARAEIDFSLFTGMAFTQNNDVRVQKNDGTDLTFHDVSFKGRDFESPPYYGGRLLWFRDQYSHWGFGGEYFHAKLYANTSQNYLVTGDHAGVAVNNVQPMDRIVQTFSISHGLNLVLGDIVYRWLPGNPGKDFLGRFQPYIGLGLGAAIPHVESRVDNSFHQNYQLRGPGLEAFAGVRFHLIEHLALMFEYKFTYAALENMSIPKGSIEMDPLTHHLVAGLSVDF